MNGLPGEEIKASISLIPNKPGVYEFYDATKFFMLERQKAKKRVQSYFQRAKQCPIKALVKDYLHRIQLLN